MVKAKLIAPHYCTVMYAYTCSLEMIKDKLLLAQIIKNGIGLLHFVSK
jgi:hypothetical protein